MKRLVINFIYILTSNSFKTVLLSLNSTVFKFKITYVLSVQLCFNHGFIKHWSHNIIININKFIFFVAETKLIKYIVLYCICILLIPMYLTYKLTDLTKFQILKIGSVHAIPQSLLARFSRQGKTYSSWKSTAYYEQCQ